jgi:hypothetical protein
VHRVAVFVVAALIAAGCSGSTAGASTSAGSPPAATATSTPTQPAAAQTQTSAPQPAGSALPSSATTPCAFLASLGLPHQAPEIEAVLPATVAGRHMSRWSVRGECWLELVFNKQSDIALFLAAFTTAANPNPNDPTQLVYGVDGRSNTTTDPPYFVFAALRPQNSDEIGAAVALLTGGALYVNPSTASDVTQYAQQTIGGKSVYVGTLAMLAQNSHQRGKPYLYETDQWLFLVITDNAAWAADAIGQLP